VAEVITSCDAVDRFWLAPVAETTHQPRADANSAVDIDTLRAVFRLSSARKWFEHQKWSALPVGERGDRILHWGADHAWVACPTNPRRSVRRWCSRWMQRPFRPADINSLVAYAVDSNKRWSDDQSAAVLEISIADHDELPGLRGIGAYDDLNYEKRLGIKRTKTAERQRRYRAKHATGARRGRPALQISEQDRVTRRKAQAAERKRRFKERKNP
jgi:hypothetical protein